MLCSETTDRLVTIFGSISVSGQLPTYPSLNRKLFYVVLKLTLNDNLKI